MLLDEKTLVTLQKLGLTYYGARVYQTLVSLGPSDATKLSQESEVPRTKIYDVLRRLEAEEWIDSERTRPIIYRARYPKEVLGERKATFNSEVDETSAELSMLYDRLMDRENPRVWLLRGTENITVKLLDLIGRARHSVMLLGALYFEGEIDPVRNELAYARKRGVNIRAITRKSIKFPDGEINPAAEMASVVPDIKIGGPEYSKFVIIDDREVLIIYSRIEGDIPDADSTIAIWIPNTSVASIQASMFNAIWNG